MISSLNQPLRISIPLTESDRNEARKFSQQQPSPTLAERTYLNALAVLSTQRYLQMINVESDLSSSYSWNAANRMIGDISDLFIPECNGRIECRPVQPGARTCWIPEELWTNRVGYIAVEIDDKNSQAILLGFFDTASCEAMPLVDLQPLDSFIDALDDVYAQDDAPGSFLAEFDSWLRNIFDDTWLAPELVLATAYRGSPSTLSDESYSTVRKAKRLELGSDSVVLVLEATPATESELEISLKIYPFEGNVLPLGLRMELLDDLELVAMKTQAGSSDNFRALNFQVPTSESFKVRLSLGENSLIQDFSGN